LLQSLMCEHAARPAVEIVQRVLESLTQFLFPLALQDDATLVIAKMER